MTTCSPEEARFLEEGSALAQEEGGAEAMEGAVLQEPLCRDLQFPKEAIEVPN